MRAWIGNLIRVALQCFGLMRVSKKEQDGLLKEKKASSVLHYLSEQEEESLFQKRAADIEEKERKRELRKCRNEEQLARKEEMDTVEAELNEVKKGMEEFDRDHIWAFNSGNSGCEFRGNPKYLFAYINYYRPDIYAYWVCPDEDTVALIKSLGFRALLSDTPAAFYAYENTGVCVSEQARGKIPFHQVKYLNLWHGMGYKLTERSRVDDTDDLRISLCAKYIKHNVTYLNNMILAVTCKMQEEQFVKDFRIPREHFLRIGYARCTYQQKYKKIKTFDHDILKRKGLPADTKIAVYAPTFRNRQGNTFLDAMDDLEKLHQCCQKKGILLVFKMHPLMEKEIGFLNAKESYKNKPYFLFWDNADDIYEVMERIDLLIYDYSSIYSDFLIAGTKRYIRYIYDMEEMIEQGNFESVEEYYSRTSGTICHNFAELLQTLDALDETYDETELEAIYQKQWEYAGEDDFEKTIQTVMDFQIADTKYPDLYSFDIFDTLLSRKGLAPESIFVAVREKMTESGLFSAYLCQNYPFIRHESEVSARVYRARQQSEKQSVRVEISMDMIFDKMREVYDLTEEQTALLKQWELELELDSVVPLKPQIDIVRHLLDEQQKVVLISDMYLPKEVLEKMLYRADPILAELPLFLSNEYGVLKTSGLLFFEVYRQAKPFYCYRKWIHYGDNKKADHIEPRKLNINTRWVPALKMAPIQKEKAETIGTYDAYKVAAMETRMCKEYEMAKGDFVTGFVAPIMVSYVDWVVRDALSKGFEILYFVSRDGHHLKRIADTLITANEWNIETKYIYASRRVWRVPSYFDVIDEDFWSNYGGNFNDISTKSKFLKALSLDEETFYRFFADIDLESIDFADWSNGQPAKELVPIVRANERYCRYLLEVAAEQREMVCDYLKQEVDTQKKGAFVEFYGRGYNQLCHSRLWNHVVGQEVPLYYYYAKSVHPTEGNCIRYNFSVRNKMLIFMESIFANMPYASVESYKKIEGKIEPVLEEIPHDKLLMEAMERLLPEYAKRYAGLELKNPQETNRGQYEFLIDYFENHQEDPFLYQNIGGLVDGVSMYGGKIPYAKPYTMKDLEEIMAGEDKNKKTRSSVMSYLQSDPLVKERYSRMFQKVEGNDEERNNPLTENQIKRNEKFRAKYEETKIRIEKFRQAYEESCERFSVDNKICVLYEGSNTELLDVIKQPLESQTELLTEYLDCENSEPERIFEVCAKARYIIVAGDVLLVSTVAFREQTVSILLRNDIFNLNYRGADSCLKLYWMNKMEELSHLQKTDYVENPAEAQKEALLSSRKLSLSALEVIKGSVLSDVYFDENSQAKARNELWAFFPESEEKKILLLLPTVKKCGVTESWIKMPDMEKMQRELGKEWIVLLDANGKQKTLLDTVNVKEIPGFSRVIPQEVNIRHMLAIADAVVGDYRDVFFESVLMKKPAFSIATDYEKEMKTGNMRYDFSSLNPFPIVEDTETLIEKIKHLENYDFSEQTVFKKQFFEYCDGRSAKRIVDFMVNDSKEKKC